SAAPGRANELLLSEVPDMARIIGELWRPRAVLGGLLVILVVSGLGFFSEKFFPARATAQQAPASEELRKQLEQLHNEVKYLEALLSVAHQGKGSEATRRRLVELYLQDAQLRAQLAEAQQQEAALEKERELAPLKEAFAGLVDLYLDQPKGPSQQLSRLS